MLAIPLPNLTGKGVKYKHRHICNLGPLTEDQAQRLRLILKTKIEDLFVGKLADVVAKEHYQFLDVAVLHHFWKEWGLDLFFADLASAEALTINRCLFPKSKIQINTWIKGTILPALLTLGDEYAIYRDLDRIADLESALQSHLYQKIKRVDDPKAIFYDLTSTYFEGCKCVLARFGYSRDKRPDQLQINIALVITPKGYPFYWQVLPGNTPDMNTVGALVADLKQRFGISDCLLVFDRGMVCEDNLKAIGAQQLKYISALSKDEIPGLAIAEPELFLGLDPEKWSSQLKEAGFTPYDETLFYREHFLNGRRYLLAFNYPLFQDNRQIRELRLQQAGEFFEQLNHELAQAQKSRDPQKIAGKITARLKKLKLHRVIAYELVPLEIGKIRSFSVKYQINQQVLNKQAFLDGLLCFVTNESPEKLKAEEVIRYYRRKNKIEEAFREIKDYLQLRPVFVTREKRVKAHVTICVLAYLLLNTIDEKLKGELWQAPQALTILGKCFLNRIGPKGSERYIKSHTEITPEQLHLLNLLNCSYLVSPKFLDPLFSKF